MLYTCIISLTQIDIGSVSPTEVLISVIYMYYLSLCFTQIDIMYYLSDTD